MTTAQAIRLGIIVGIFFGLATIAIVGIALQQRRIDRRNAANPPRHDLDGATRHLPGRPTSATGVVRRATPPPAPGSHLIGHPYDRTLPWDGAR